MILTIQHIRAWGYRHSESVHRRNLRDFRRITLLLPVVYYIFICVRSILATLAAWNIFLEGCAETFEA
jgi:hypothetical protein